MSDKTFGVFGEFGGRHVPPHLDEALKELEDAYKSIREDASFWEELAYWQKHFIGRPTPLLFAANATEALGGAKIYLKLEGLANTGAHKINNALGQALLAKKMGKRAVIAETGAGQHGLASACAAARVGLECHVYMGANDVARQHPNVFWMEMFGATVVPVHRGTKTLTDAVDEAIMAWAETYQDTHYLLGSAVGPAPYPDMVRDFQSVIGREVRSQFADLEGRLPDLMIACVGGGSNAMGFFAEFLDEPSVCLRAVEGGGRGQTPGEHAARLAGMGRIDVHQGYRSYFLEDDDGELLPTHSISAGLDYVGVGPQLAHLHDSGRMEFTYALDSEALDAMKFFAKHEGVIAALESSHAMAEAMKIAPTMGKDQSLVVNMSGRGDKDIFITGAALDEGGEWLKFLHEEVARLEQGR
jgi:tryptophan synthase beta chain